MQDSKDIANIAIDTFCKKQATNVTDENLVCIIKISTDINKKLVFITNILKGRSCDYKTIRHLLDAMGSPYTEVGNINKKPLVANNSLHRDLLDALKTIKFIASYKEEKEGQYLRVYPSKHSLV